MVVLAVVVLHLVDAELVPVVPDQVAAVVRSRVQRNAFGDGTGQVAARLVTQLPVGELLHLRRREVFVRELAAHERPGLVRRVDAPDASQGGQIYPLLVRAVAMRVDEKAVPWTSRGSSNTNRLLSPSSGTSRTCPLIWRRLSRPRRSRSIMSWRAVKSPNPSSRARASCAIAQPDLLRRLVAGVGRRRSAKPRHEEERTEQATGACKSCSAACGHSANPPVSFGRHRTRRSGPG